ncbi:hypothetical protein [Methanoregula sp.]|uniref:hypothetical protein n=1 Tax=Methanoregula sp. TaxID=2052170 RepID=UPI002B80764A|nr:hypothetical protein [Methanoregula sp.]HVP96236.1 hypothetical protein [Methanoregula sp.]
MEHKDPARISGTISALHKTLWTEIHKERERHRRLYASGTPGRVTLVILGVAILVNIFFFIENPIYPLLFVSASFFLFMFYFITLLIPHNLRHTTLPQTEISRYLVRLRENGIIVSTKRFTRVFLNAFFINCRPLFYGFALIFSLDILLVLAMAANGTLSPTHTGIILFQSIAIITFYFLVWKLEPYTIDFFSGVSGMKAHLIRRKIPEQVVSFLFLLGAALALIAIVSTIILLPGMTVSNVLSVTELKELGHFFLAIGVAIVTLYFIMRYIHGITSRDLLNRFTEDKAACLLRQIEITSQSDRTVTGGEATEDPGVSALCKAAALLLETQIYQVEQKTLLGTFPVYIVNPDFSWVFSTHIPQDNEKITG